MQSIPLQPIPNQSFSLQLDQINYDLRIRDCGNVLAVDIVVNNTTIVTGARAVNGFPLIPYAYLDTPVGNFIFVNAGGNDEDYPYWAQFGGPLSLIYLSPQELKAFSYAQFVQGVLNGTGT